MVRLEFFYERARSLVKPFKPFGEGHTGLGFDNSAVYGREPAMIRIYYSVAEQGVAGIDS